MYRPRSPSTSKAWSKPSSVLPSFASARTKTRPSSRICVLQLVADALDVRAIVLGEVLRPRAPCSARRTSSGSTHRTLRRFCSSPTRQPNNDSPLGLGELPFRGVITGLRVVLGSALVLIAGFAAAASGSPNTPTTNGATFVDGRGEDPGSPDITTVLVSNDDTGRLTFRVETPSHQALTEDMRIRIWLSDADPTTGLSEGGADYFILVDAYLLGLGRAALYQCDGMVCSPVLPGRPSCYLTELLVRERSGTVHTRRRRAGSRHQARQSPHGSSSPSPPTRTSRTTPQPDSTSRTPTSTSHPRATRTSRTSSASGRHA